MAAKTKTKKKAKKTPSRNYSKTTLKMLFAFSGNQCARPDCEEPIVASATKFSPAAVIGQIAHIYAHSDGGPRSKPNLTEAERCAFENVLLLCPTHHVGVDTQFATFPEDLLLGWKATHERKFHGKLSRSIAEIGYAELEVAARALMSAAAIEPDGSLAMIAPKEKIQNNGLGPTSEGLLKMGAAKSQEVEEVLRKSSQLDPSFPDRLREGFTNQYSKLYAEGIRGDALFLEMYDWAAGDGKNKVREAAGLCVLTHLFIICDVFEK